MTVTAVLGAQWGDEGKGKLVDVLARDGDIVARFSGGNNAGHTVITEQGEFKFHLLPSGVVWPHTLNVIGNGVVVDPDVLLDEITGLEARGISIEGRLIVSESAPTSSCRITSSSIRYPSRRRGGMPSGRRVAASGPPTPTRPLELASGPPSCATSKRSCPDSRSYSIITTLY